MSLYKYVRPERIDIIENERIRFTQPAMFNDPFDTRPNLLALTDDEWIASFLKEEIENDEKLKKLSEESLEKEFSKYGATKEHPLFGFVLQKMKEMTKTLAPDYFESIFKLQLPIFKNAIFEAMNNTIGVLSLTEKPDSILMWGHYAESHKGFVIEFDEKHPFFDQRKKIGEIQGYVRKVNYFRERPKLTIYDSSKSEEENINNLIEKFIWAKNIDWEYEQEWRMIYTFRNKENIVIKITPDIYLFPLPIDCVRGIIMGCRISEENKGRLISFLKDHAKYRHIHIYQATEDEKEFRINIC